MAWTSAEVHPFTLMAPAPFVLAGSDPKLDHVVKASSTVVRASRRALPLGCVTVEKQPLAFVAPAPVVLSNDGRRETVVADTERHIGQLAAASSVPVVHVQRRGNELHFLMRVQYFARVCVHHHVILPLVLRESEKDVPSQLEFAPNREPCQTGLDLVAKRALLEHGGVRGRIRKRGDHFRNEIGDIDARFRRDLSELILELDFLWIRLCDGFGGGTRGLLDRELATSTDIAVDSDDRARVS